MKTTIKNLIFLLAIFLSANCFAETKGRNMNYKEIDQKYSCEQETLGLNFSNGIPSVKLWAPLAESVDFLLFNKDNQKELICRIPMNKKSSGIWQISLNENNCSGLKNVYGYYYQFEVKNPNRDSKKVLDPYAKSMAPVTVSRTGESSGSSGDFTGKAAIVDPSRHGEAKALRSLPGFNKREDAIIYEVSVRDFTSDPIIEKDLHHRWGTFSAFIDKLPYIKSMGVTHIQLLPVMAWYYGDETKTDRDMSWTSKSETYNWGYDPHNYFSLDGFYSENPNDPALRIAEFKNLVNAIHEEGMGVILDAVYTHMIKTDFLDDIVPNYYFFQDSKGNFIGAFGNNLATNRKMASKLLVDSVKYWHEEYKIDGIRFDMMGDATREVIQRAYNEAVKINPNTLFLGEGWRTFSGHLDTPSLKGKGADQDWMKETHDVAVFSDEVRNDLKSGFGCEGEPRFLTGGAMNREKLLKNIKGQPTNFVALDPGAVVQYIEAHDNLPLFDVIAQSIKEDPDKRSNEKEIHKRIRLGNTFILTAQGIAFLHAGQEYGRTKQWFGDKKPEQKYHILTKASGKPFKHPYFIHDSYNSSDAINKFDWNKATNPMDCEVNAATIEYTKGLIQIRRSSDAFRLGSKELVDKNVTMIDAPELHPEDLLFAYKCESTKKEAFYVFINASDKTKGMTLKEDLTSGKILADNETAGLEPIKFPKGVRISERTIIIDPLTAVIIKK